MGGFGQYDQGAGGSAHQISGEFRLLITGADVRRGPDGQPLRDAKSNKVRFRATFKILGPRFVGETLKRDMNVSFAPSQEGAYGPFPAFLQAATGIKCGDPAQREIGSEQLVGRELGGLVRHRNGYNDIIEFLPASEPQPTHAAPPGDHLDQDLGHRGGGVARPQATIGEPQQRQIRAIATALGIAEQQLAEFVWRHTQGRTRAVAGVGVGAEFEALLADLKERAKRGAA